MGQLELGQEVPLYKDSYGNVCYIEGNVVVLKLASQTYARRIGIILNDRFIVYRDKEKHLFRQNQSYGFNHDVIVELEKHRGIKFVDVYDDDGLYRMNINDIRTKGEFLFFKEQGFERQVFIPIRILYQHSFSLEIDEKRKELLGYSWFNKLKAEFHKDYMLKLGVWLAERRMYSMVLPEKEEIFRAFKLCPYENVKVVFVGQDPYFTKGVADGLAFSCKIPHFVPPSLQKMYEALEEDVHFGLFLDNDPDLSRWAEHGVLLLNSNLTTEQNVPGAHEGVGWEKFNAKVIELLNNHPKPLAFVFLGAKAKKFRELVTDGRHLVIEVEHPAYACRQARKWNHQELFKRVLQFVLMKHDYRIGW